MLRYGVVVDRKDTESKYVEPKKTVEKQRVFEFLSKVLKTESTTARLLDEESFISEVTNLETKLKKKKNLSENDEISPFQDQDLNKIFDVMNGSVNNDDGDSVSVDSGLTMATNDTNLTDTTQDTNKENQETEDDKNEPTFTISNVSLGKAHKYSTCDVLLLADEKMKEHNFNDIRMRKKQRRERNDEFLYSLFQKLDGPNNTVTTFHNWLKDGAISNIQNNHPYDFAVSFRDIKKRNM